MTYIHRAKAAGTQLSTEVHVAVQWSGSQSSLREAKAAILEQYVEEQPKKADQQNKAGK